MVSTLDVAEAIRDLIRALDHASAAGSSEFQIDSPAQRNWQANELPGHWGPQLLQDAYCTGLMFSWYVRDHAAALADAIEHGRSFAFMTLARGLAESAARCWYLLEPNIEPLERVRRLVNDILTAAFEEESMWKGTSGSVDDDSQLVRDRVRMEAHKRGMPYVEQQRGSKFTPARIGEPRPSSRALLDQITHQPKVAALFYRTTSGVIHSGLHSLRGRLAIVPGTNRAGVIELDAERIFMECTLAIQVYVSCISAIMHQTGWPDDEVQRALEGAERIWQEIERQTGAARDTA
jgi:hypothetical protein